MLNVFPRYSSIVQRSIRIARESRRCREGLSHGHALVLIDEDRVRLKFNFRTRNMLLFYLCSDFVLDVAARRDEFLQLVLFLVQSLSEGSQCSLQLLNFRDEPEQVK